MSLLLIGGHSLDAADGQLARLSASASAFGEWFDHVVDAAKCACFHVAVLVSLYRFAALPAEEWLLVPLAFGAVDSTFFFANVLKDQLRVGRLPAGETDAYLRPDRERSPILPSVVLSAVDYGVLCISIAALPWTRVFLTVYTCLLVAKTAYLLAGLRRWGRVVASY